MSDPFTIYKKHPHADAYRVGAGYTMYAIIAKEKRFTDAELCAEFEASRCDAMVAELEPTGTYWVPLGETWADDLNSAHYRTMTLLRFATLPHFDE